MNERNATKSEESINMVPPLASNEPAPNDETYFTANTDYVDHMSQTEKRKLENLTITCLFFFFIPGTVFITYAAIYQRMCVYACNYSTISGVYGGLCLIGAALLVVVWMFHYTKGISLNYEKYAVVALLVLHIGAEVVFAMSVYKLMHLERKLTKQTEAQTLHKKINAFSNVGISLTLKILLAFNLLQIIYLVFLGKKLMSYTYLSSIAQSKGEVINNNKTIYQFSKLAQQQ